MTKNVLAIAAHPDDIEFLMSGTMLALRLAGYQLHYMNLSSGCCGSMITDRDETARVRRLEAMAAAQAMGAVYHESVSHDLDILYERETLAKVASVVRAAAPSILLTHSPIDYMEDHVTAGRLAVTAAFALNMPNFPVDPPRGPVAQTVTIYHAQPYGNVDPLRQPVRPELFVDVSDVLEKKVELLAMHKSQKEWLDASQGLDSYLQTLRDLDAQVGQMSGKFSHAEGWRRRLHLGYCGPDDDPLSEALADRVLPGSV